MSHTNAHEDFIHSFSFAPIRERIPVRVDDSDGVLSYGKDNLYPQRVEQIVFRSGLTGSCIMNLAEFTNGRGFKDRELGRAVVNESSVMGEVPKQITMNDILRFNAWDYSFFNAFALHFTYNLNFEISSVTPIFSKFCRFSWNSNTQKIDGIKFSRNWERNYNKYRRDRKIEFFYLFNPDKEVVANEVLESGGIENYPGQILYASGWEGIYPRTEYDAVLDSCQSNGEIPVYELGNLQNGFHPSMIFKYPGEFENEQERWRIEERVRAMVGARQAGGVMVIETPQEELQTFDFLETIAVQNRDKQFEFTSKNVRDTIVQSFAVPPILVGFQPQSGVISSEEMVSSYNFYNEKTGHRRRFVSEQYEKWVPFYMDPLTSEEPVLDKNGDDTRLMIDPMVFVPTQAAPVVTPTGQVLEQDPNSGDLKILPGTGPTGAPASGNGQPVKATPING